MMLLLVFLLNFILINFLISTFFFIIVILFRLIAKEITPLTKSRVYFGSLIFPPVLSLMVLATSLIPPIFFLVEHGQQICINDPYRHLFFYKPSPEVLTNPLFIGFAILAVGSIIFPLLRMMYSHYRLTISLLPLFSNNDYINLSIENRQRDYFEEIEDRYSIKIYIIPIEKPIAFLSGFFSSKLICSKGLLDTLSFDELQGLINHEIAHHLRKDNLLQGLLIFSKNLLILSPTGHYLLGWWKEQIELVCDEFAVFKTKKPLEIAQALLTMERSLFDIRGKRIYALAMIGSNQSMHISGFYAPDKKEVIEERVKRIISFSDLELNSFIPSFYSKVPGAVLFWGIFLTFSLVFSAVSLYNPLLFHCQLEKVVQIVI